MLPFKNSILGPAGYEVHEKLFEINSYKYQVIINLKTGKKCIERIFKHDINELHWEKILDFSREVYILSRLNHPNIIKFVEFSLINLKNESKPIIISDYTSNFTLYQLLHPDMDFSYSPNFRLKFYTNAKFEKRLDDTKVLIIIFVIAFGMSYLHLHNIIHRDLNPLNVFIDESFFPKIAGFFISRELPNDGIIKEGKLKGTLPFLAPEVLTDMKYSKSSDVYSFAIILYIILNKCNPYDLFSLYKFENISKFIKYIGIDNKRFKIKCDIPECYKKLIEKCWLKDPSQRPSFIEIVRELKTNPEFITDKVDKDEYLNAIKTIEEKPISFEPAQNFQQIDELIQSKIKQFPNFELDLKLKSIYDSGPYCDLRNFHFEYNDLIDNKTNLKVSYLSYQQELNQFLRYEIKSFCKTINIISQLNHPAILKFIGLSFYNFDNQPKPVIINEYSVSDCAQYFDDTTKLCVIYGIASGMSYLHSHNIIHRNLTLENIKFSEKHFFPKITGFSLAKEINDDEIKDNKTIKGTPAYIAPEVYNYEGYSKASDVYSYSLIIYELMAKTRPYKEMISIKDIIYDKEFIIIPPKVPIPKCYLDLIHKCWECSPEDRPTFDEIVFELKTNPNFITDSINKEFFFEYVRYLDEFPSTFDSRRKIKQLDDILKLKLNSFADIKPLFKKSSVYETEMINVFDKGDKINYLSLKKDLYFTDNDSFYEIKKFYIKYSEMKFYGKQTYSRYNEFYKSDIINFSRELNMLLQLNHPAIHKIIDYFVVDKKPLILTEITSKGTLNKILELEKKDDLKLNNNSIHDDENDSIEKSNDTNILIIIYGIACGMSYLHSHNIIHRDLKPSNIYIDDSFYPKISGFIISKEIDEVKIEKNKTIKGTPAYIAPEVYNNQGYRKASDVYSFSLIMYELLTKTKPYADLVSPIQIKQFVAEKGLRPFLNNTIPKYYRQLIEKCWSQEPELRLTFNEIVLELKTNSEYIKENVDIEKYRKYIKYIDKTPISFEPNNKIQQLSEYVNAKLYRFPENLTKINIRNIYETETNNVLFKYDFINIFNFEKCKVLLNEINDKIYTIQNKQTKTIYLAVINKMNQSLFYESYLSQFYFEINSNLELNHPSLLKFIGFSPLDFKNRPNRVIIKENASNGSLDKIIEIEKTKKIDSFFNNTKKLINIFGIASCLSYLYSKNIIAFKLRPSMIFLDDFLFPKIFLTHIRKDSEDFDELRNSPNAYDPPEYINNGIYRFPAVVYTFGMIIYYIIINEEPILKKRSLTIHSIDNNLYESTLPPINKTIPECYRNIIKKCWSFNPKERPTFDDIIYELKTNQEFIYGIDNKEFRNYIKYIESCKSNDAVSVENSSKNQVFEKVKIDFRKFYDWSKFNFSVNLGSIDLNSYEKQSKIGSGSFGVAYKINNKETGEVLAAKVSIYEIEQCSNDIILNLSREIEIFSILDHPSILKFIGYSPKKF